MYDWLSFFVAVVRSACGSCFLWCGPYIVESAELMSGITPGNSDSDSTPELLEQHDRGKAPPLRSVLTSGEILSPWSPAAASRAKRVITLSKSSPIVLEEKAKSKEQYLRRH